MKKIQLLFENFPTVLGNVTTLETSKLSKVKQQHREE